VHIRYAVMHTLKQNFGVPQFRTNIDLLQYLLQNQQLESMTLENNISEPHWLEK
jgi:hypothetical protein